MTGEHTVLGQAEASHARATATLARARNAGPGARPFRPLGGMERRSGGAGLEVDHLMLAAGALATATRELARLVTAVGQLIERYRSGGQSVELSQRLRVDLEALDRQDERVRRLTIQYTARQSRGRRL